MTRINASIPPAKLSNKHLLSEAREIKRIPNCIKSGRYDMKGQPNKFTLGTGHVKFFYDKLLYLYNRYQAIHTECLKREFNVTDYSDAWDGLSSFPHLWNDWEETLEAKILISERINLRLGLSGDVNDWREC